MESGRAEKFMPPANDDEDLRRLNTKKLAEGVERVGNHFKELRKQNRVNFIIGGLTALCILVLMGSVVYSAFSVGGGFLDNLVDKDKLIQRYNCTLPDGHYAVFREPASTKVFIEIFPDASCTYYRKGE